MELESLNGRDLISEMIEKKYADSKLTECIAPGFTVCVNVGYPTGRPHIFAYLDVSDEGMEEIYQRTHIYMRTKKSFEEFLNCGDTMKIKLLTYFHNNSSQIIVEAAMSDTAFKKVHRGAMDLTKQEHDMLVKCIEDTVGTHFEDHIAKTLTPKTIVSPVSINCPEINGDLGYIRFYVNVSEKELETLMSRSNGFRQFEFETLEDFRDCKFRPRVLATVTADGKVWVDLVKLDLENNENHRIIAVPYKDDEKELLRQIVEQRMGKTIAEALKEAPKGSEEGKPSQEDKNTKKNNKNKIKEVDHS